MSFAAAFEATLLTIARTREILSLAVLSVLLYAFYYPAPYEHQSAQALPFVVVATLVAGAFLLGWRAIASLARLARRRAAG